MKLTSFSNRLRVLTTLCMLMFSTQVVAVAPCPPSPCKDEASAVCEQSTDWIAEGVITEVHIRSFERHLGLPQISGQVLENYQAQAISIKFLPEKVLKGNAPVGESTLSLHGCFYQLPGIEQMRPRRLTIRVQKGSNYSSLISYKNSPAPASQ